MRTINGNGAQIPAIGMGTWTLTGPTAVDLIAHGLRLGYRHIDTAARYGNEQEVGDAIRASGVLREEIFLTTKVWPTDLAPADFERSVANSLKLLGTDYVDLLLIHWPNPAVPLSDSVGALNLAHQRGQARHIGVSNFTLAMFEEARKLSARPLSAHEVERHPFFDQSRMAEACRAAGSVLIAYTPLARAQDLFDNPTIASIAKAHGVSPTQVVLSWHCGLPGNVPVPRTSNKDRLAENLRALDLILTADERAAIDALQSANRRLVNTDFSPVWDKV
jgi:diketogulonate reductase-like aldo/keto reductase